MNNKIIFLVTRYSVTFKNVIGTALVSQGPGHRTTSFSVLDILDPNKFTSKRRQQHAGRRGEREPEAYAAEKRRGVTREAFMEASKEEFQSESSLAQHT